VIRVDADTVGGTLLFTQEGATVVAEAGDRRDARSGSAETGEEAAAASTGRLGSLLDLPSTAPPKKDGGEERLN